MKPYAFGVDIGGTTVKIGFFSSNGKFVEHWEIPTRKEDNGSMILPDIASAIAKKMDQYNITIDDIEGVGVGVPGPVLGDGVVSMCVNLGWGKVDVREELTSLLGGVPVEVGNDANVAALGEQWNGGGKGHDNVVMVTLGTGVGGGIILGGKILHGAHGAGGEIGHITVNRNETIACGCGKKGCLEQYASATGIARKAREVLATPKAEGSSLLKVENVDAKAVFDAAKTGDKTALAIVDFFGRTLGQAVATITAVVDPDVIVVGGGVSKAGQILLDAVVKYYTPNAFNACKETPFKLAVLGKNAGMYGAVKMVLD
jgi:glucokinase